MSVPRFNNCAVLSPELACFHEAGHVVTAVTIGASVESVKIEEVTTEIGKTASGQTWTDRTLEQAPLIACGGFAAEYFLCVHGRLLNGSGQVAHTGEFLGEAVKNASIDLRRFQTAKESLGYRVEDWQEEFMGTALVSVYPNIDFKLVERVATALLETSHLNRAQVASLVGYQTGWISKVSANYRLLRMLGHGRVKSFAIAGKNRRLGAAKTGPSVG